MKKDLIEFYENARQYYLIYHNHKELSAWGGLALEVLISSFIIVIEIPEANQSILNIVLSLVELLISAFLLGYIINQLKMKKFAGDLTGAATIILSEIILTEESKLNISKYMLIDERTFNSKSQIPYIQPAYFLSKAKGISNKGSGFHIFTKSTIIWIFLFTTIAVLFCRLLPILNFFN